MGADIANFSEGESKWKRLKLLNTKNNYDLSDEVSPFDDLVWENLPYVALVEIYRCLPQNDKFNLSLTCKAWNQTFYRPEAWPNVTFRLNGRDDWRALSFNGPLTTSLRHLNIDCQETKQSPKRYTASESTENIYSVIESMINNKNHRLLTLKLTNMDRLTWWFKGSSPRDVVKVLGDLLSTQTTLQVLDLSNADFNDTQGTDILTVMARACGSTVTELTINNLVRKSFHMCMATQLGAFSKLAELSISCMNMSDDLLKALAANGSLKRMDLNLLGYSYEIPSIQSWEHLMTSCPDLEAHFFIHEFSGFAEGLVRILAPCIHLVELELDWSYMKTLWEDFCDYIANNFQNHLRQLKIMPCGSKFTADHIQVIIDRCLLLEEISIIKPYDNSYGYPERETLCAFVTINTEASIERSVRKALARQPASRLRKFTLYGVDVNLKPT